MSIISWVLLAFGILMIGVGVRVALLFKNLSREERQKALNHRFFLKLGVIGTTVGLLFLLLAILRDYKLWTSIVVIIVGIINFVVGLIIKNKYSQNI